MIDQSLNYPGSARQARADRLAPWLAEARALLKLAGPLVAAQLAQMAIMTTDVVLLGRLSTEALAAAAIGNTVYFFAWLVGTGPAHAVSPMIAHVLGARPRDRAAARAITRMALWGVAALSLPLIVLMLFAGPILKSLGQEPRLAEDAGVFVAMLAIGLPFTLGFQVLRNFATAVGRPNATLWVTLASIVWNGVAAYALIFGHIGAPRLGLVGGGLATASSSIFAFFLMLGLCYGLPSLRQYRILRRVARASWPKLAEIFRLGVPIGLTLIFEAMLFNSMTLVVGTFGADQLAAHQIALNFASFTFMVPLGVALAATVRVGLHAGAGDLVKARRAGLTAMAASIVLCGITSYAMAVHGGAIARLYLSAEGGGGTERVIMLAALFLKVAAAFQLFDSLQVVGAMALRGLKDTRTPMVLAAISYWVFGAPVCLALGVWLGWQGLGVWIGLAFGLAVATVLMCGRFLWLTRRSA